MDGLINVRDAVHIPGISMMRCRINNALEAVLNEFVNSGLHVGKPVMLTDFAEGFVYAQVANSLVSVSNYVFDHFRRDMSIINKDF